MSISSIGIMLKETRDKKSLSLDEVHAKTKIHPRVLQLLEEGKFDKLPSPIFAKSFLRSYAEFLGVNCDEVLETYEKNSEIKKEPDQVLFIKSVEEKNEDAYAHKSVLGVGLLIGAVVIGVWALAFMATRFSDAFHNSKFPNPSGWFSRKPVSAESAKPVKPVKPVVRKESAEPVKKEKKSEDWVRTPGDGNFPKLSKKASLELRLRALDNVWVRVTGDGKVLYQGIMGRNAVDTWTTKESFELWTGNASNMFLSVNRFSLGSPGKGMIRKMIITREGVRIPSPENR